MCPVRVRAAPGSSMKRAMPKSAIFVVPSASTSRLPGLMSRCTIPWSCATASPAAVWAAMRATRSAGSGPFSLRIRARLSPATSSMTRNRLPSYSPKSSTPTTFPWCSRPAVWASSRNLEVAVGSASWPSMSLTATSLPSVSSDARQTSPIAPRPRAVCNRYRPAISTCVPTSSRETPCRRTGARGGRARGSGAHPRTDRPSDDSIAAGHDAAGPRDDGGGAGAVLTLLAPEPSPIMIPGAADGITRRRALRSDQVGWEGRGASSADPSGVRCVRLHSGGGRRGGALATDDNAAGGTPTPVQGSGGVRAGPRDAGMIRTRGPDSPPRRPVASQLTRTNTALSPPDPHPRDARMTA
ncbi:hypothetical protein B0E37_06233 [Streptomyces sp. MH192]|nr:hypothetical protein [Streptomyces sp. MH192]MCF0103644.1 hypothetical protein [Streptomyces sp. MH191]